MSLIPKDQMTELFSASQVAETASTAEEDIQLKSVAFAINQAANTGLYRIIYQEKLKDSVKEALEAKGYTIKYVDNNAYDMQHHALIIWGDVKAGDAFVEPSNSGPKYNTKKEG